MKKGKAFVLVSNRRWGKSHALAALTGGKPARRFVIEGTRFVVRRITNDEDDIGFFDMLDVTYPDAQPHLIMALCPTFKDKRRRVPLVAALNTFRQRYDLFLFVLARQDKPPGKRLSKADIETLKQFGTVAVFGPTDAAKRARAFKKFILEHL